MTNPELVDQLKTLADLRTSGVITEEEFTRAKAKVLGSTAPEDPAPPAAEPAWWHEPEQQDRPKPPELSPSPAPSVSARPAPSGPRPTGAYALTGASAVALLAFFAMPMASLGFVGSLTGAQVAGLSSQVGALGLLWVVPLAAAAAAATGAWMSFSPTIVPEQRRGGSIVAAIAAGLAILVYLVALAGVQSQLAGTGASQSGVSATSFTGAGFWIGLLSLAVAVVAAIREVSASKT